MKSSHGQRRLVLRFLLLAALGFTVIYAANHSDEERQAAHHQLALNSIPGPSGQRLAPVTSAPLQSGGNFNISPSIVAGGGGGGPSSGGNLAITSSIGQHTLGVSSGGSISIAGGFWGPEGSCPTLTLPMLPLPPIGKVGTPYNHTLPVTGGTPSYTCMLISGSLPPGVSLSPNCTLSGTPSAAGTFNFTIKATDANGCMGMQAYAIIINPAPCNSSIALNPPTLPAGKVGMSYSQTLTASGGTAPYSFSLSLGALPPGLLLSAEGLLSGTPSTQGTFVFISKATDAGGCAGRQLYAIVVNDAACPAITLNLLNLPSGTSGTAYNQTLTANGGVAPYNFSVIQGALPTGVALSANSVLSGTPSAVGTAVFVVKATDASGCAGTELYVLVINNIGCPTPLLLSPSTLPGGMAGALYNQTLTANGVNPHVFSLFSGAPPPGLNLLTNGMLTGTPSATGSFDFTVKTTDANGCMGVRRYQVSITASCLLPLTLPQGRAGETYNQPLTPVLGTPPHTCTLNGGGLPNGMGLSSACVLSGTPTTFGAFTFNVKVTAANNVMCTQDYTLMIHPPCTTITVNPPLLNNGFVGTAYNQTFSASGGVAPYTFSVSAGALPDGLTLNATTGALIGMPTTVGSFNFTIKATDATGCAGTRSYNVIISGNGLMFYPLARPIRLLDTRPGFMGCDAPGAPIQGGTARTQFARRTCDGLTVPPNAQALTGNITTVESEGGYLTLYPSDAAQPLVASSNYTANEIVNNVFTVGLGNADGAFKIFALNTTHVVVDVSGYFAPPSAHGLFFHPLPHPVRLLETRPEQPVGCYRPGLPLTAGGIRTQPARGLCDGLTIPANAQAIIGNATVVATQGIGYLTLWPANAAQPLVANGNYVNHDTINTPFTVGLAPTGEFNIFTLAQTHLVVDVLGYYSTEASDQNGLGLLFTPLARPVRLLETRPGLPVGCFKPGMPLPGGAETLQTARGLCDGLTIPPAALGVVGNATVVQPAGIGFLTLWPSTATRPLVATSNYTPGEIGNRHFIVGLGSADGAFKLYTHATTHLVIDLSGYFAP